MQIDKSQVIEMLKAKGEDAKVERVEAEFPSRVDPYDDTELLAKFDIDPKDLMGKVPGNFGG